MDSVEFEPTTPAVKRLLMYALNHTDTGIGHMCVCVCVCVCVILLSLRPMRYTDQQHFMRKEFQTCFMIDGFCSYTS